MKTDVIIIGGGAAGLMCAIEAGKRGRSVRVIERSERLGKKILVSGGGRCNFTNVHASPENYISENPGFCKSALARYTPADFISLVEKHGIRYHEKKLGQLFCDGSSRQVVELLEKECRAAGVEIHLGCEVQHVHKNAVFHLKTSQGELDARSLVIATGGLSFPKLGATDFGYRIAKQFGLKVLPPRPGLVPLTSGQDELEMFRGLSGVSVDVTAECNGAGFRENLLFTHHGLSGPAILQVSNYWRAGDTVRVDLLPGRSARDILDAGRQGNRELAAVLGGHLPRRFAQAWCKRFVPARPASQMSARELGEIAQRLHRWEIHACGTEGYGKAEVTLGGVDTRELSSKTMEAGRVPGLFFIGEAVDVTGWLGGFNFQWAWASGHAAGVAVAIP